MYLSLCQHFVDLDDSKEDIQNSLKRQLERCLIPGDRISKWEHFVKPENDVPKPFAGFANQLCLQVICQIEGTAAHEHYEDLQKKWIQEMCWTYFPEYHRAWLALTEPEKALPICRTNAHKNISLDGTFYFGVLSHPSRFQDLGATFLNPMRGRGDIVNFFYDSRRILIELEHLLKIEIPFSSLSKIFVSARGLVLNILNPPLFYRGKHRYHIPNPEFRDKFGRSNAILLEFSSILPEILSRLHFLGQKIGFQVYFTSLTFDYGSLNGLPPTNGLQFANAYLVEALTRRSLVIQAQGFVHFIATVQELEAIDSVILEHCLSELLMFNDAGCIQSYASVLRVLFKYHKLHYYKALKIQPHNTKLVRRMIVTPSRIVLWPAEINADNRVLRKFDRNFSLRVVFRDDDYVKLNQRQFEVQNNQKTLIHDLIHYPFSQGFNIAGRYYEFLAWSNSQVRDHGAWMYSKDNDSNDAASIRSWMGNFSNIKCIAKYMARMGQCFSSTSDILSFQLEKEQYTIVPDIKDGRDPETRKPYTFSDGIGRISQKLVTQLCQAMKLPKECSAFQIRFAGMKGMLALDPNPIQVNGTDIDIEFRESQKKFECPNSSILEICKISQATVVALNRPLVNILNQLGVPKEVFLGMQKKTLVDCTEMFFEEEKAAECLSMHHNLKGVSFQSLFQSGIQLTTEPFFHGMMLAVHTLDIAMLLRKVRLHVAPNEGRNMFGVLDESNTLEYGQVFVQYTTNIIGQDHNLDYTVLQGEVLVTKNPCYQAGDVRKFLAVDIPNLHHHRDCIVFPRKGKRPHPNEMSGSDLDGDEYTVIWKKELLFPGRNKRPQDFPASSNSELSRNVQMSDAIDFMVDFVSWDNLGMLAISHLARSDYHRQGIFSAPCCNLARKCSVAVDSAKNGQFVKGDPEVMPKQFPDFLEKHSRAGNYRSKRALGHLYRACRSVCNFDVTSTSSYGTIEMDPLLVYEGWEEHREEAVYQRDQYESYLENLMTKYGIRSESELMSGCFNKLHGRFSIKNGRNEIEELINLILKALWEHMEKLFIQEFEDDADPEEIYRKASGWYVVTYNRPNPRMLSFAWIPSKWLALLKLTRRSELNQVLSPQPIIDKFTQVIQESRHRLVHFFLEVTRFMESWPVFCNCVELAVQLLLTWALHNNICTRNNLLDLIQYFMEQMLPESEGIDSRVCLNCQPGKPIRLVINFFATFMEAELRQSTLIPTHRLARISRMATYSYQRIAVTGALDILGVSVEGSAAEMLERTISMSGEILKEIREADIVRHLLNWSGVREVNIREENDVLLVWAFGENSAVLKLEELIAKGSIWLQRSMKRGYMIKEDLDE